MKIEKFGSGKNLFNIIVGVHGDEVAPILGFLKLKEYLERVTIKKSFSVIIANEKAIKETKRFIKTDLNRCFPGKANGFYEQQLAKELVEATAKSKFNFDFHSTTVDMKPYGIIAVYGKKLHKIMEITGVKEYVFDNSESLIKFSPNALAFEVGREDGADSAGNAFKIMKNILRHFKVIDDKIKRKPYVPGIYLIYHFVLKSVFSSISPRLFDFKYIRKGEIIGYARNKKPITASEGFYPILVNDAKAIKKAKRITIEE